ncbi:hypothetical protein BRD56_06670 [Thermoplasmatales archaeon SW_10_69_26]|nr:MAG: hypothetical protein BRD56_06670 [Thermoplasmatales archaeon SW_10_69_26]
MRWQALLLAAMVLTTGCIGMGDDADQDVDSQTNDDTPSEDEQLNDTETDEPQTRTEWSTETYEGSITGTTVFTPEQTSDGQSFSFTVENGTQQLFINLTTDGGELTMYVAGPDCSANDDCEEQVETESGEAQYAAEAPGAGEWNVRFFPQDPVASDVSYTADVAQGVLVEV